MRMYNNEHTKGVFISTRNNFYVKTNFNTPTNAHFERSKYVKDGQTYHKCELHITTNLSATNFDSVVCTVKNGNDILSQEVDDTRIVIQDDVNPRIATSATSLIVKAIYTTAAYQKERIVTPNKTITCSKTLKLHKGLRPFNYNKLVLNMEE